MLANASRNEPVQPDMKAVLMAPTPTAELVLSPPGTDVTEREARFEAVYAANHAMILGYALRRTLSPDDAADILAAALRALPEQDRELLTLAAWEALDYGQIAAVLGCSRNAVRIRLHRARARLTSELTSKNSRG
jgi:DNA-directed RNA polymerase specialized sigma24 family protein